MEDSLPASGYAFAGQELNPLERYESFQLIAPTSSGLTVVQLEFGH